MGPRFSYCEKRALLVIFSWIWLFIGAFISSVIIYYIVNGMIPRNSESLFDLFYKRPFLASYVEVTAVGGLQLIISLACRDDRRIYGVTGYHISRSILFSIIVAVLLLLPRMILDNGIVCEDFGLDFPLNIFYATLALLAYGPLEVFFVIWLSVNTNRMFKFQKRVLPSLGLLITVVAYGLAHLVLAPRGGFVNAIMVTVEFLVLGVIYEYTRNSIGPMIAWTLINSQVSYLVTGCLM